MISKRFIAIFFLMGMALLAGDSAKAEQMVNTDRSLSPYFFVQSDDSETDRLPLKSTEVQVDISGVIADVVVRQVYKNEGNRAIEAIYVFPASVRAAVYGMKMSIGDRTIVAKIKTRKAARQAYEQAKQDGKTASLLEQHRPNVFQMNVANILPGDIVKVELRYTELLVPEDAEYEFVYPTVVGPRYTEKNADAASSYDAWTKNPYLHQDKPPTYSFDIDINLAAGVPIQDIGCSTHKVNVAYEGPALASISLDKNEKYGGNRDYILKYRLSGRKIETGLLLYEGKKENYFLLMFQPPKRTRKEMVPPREYIFIVDVSGSMRGFPLETSKKLLKNLISNLNSNDKFNVLLFAGCSSLMSETSLPATRNNISSALSFIDQQRGGGGTRLLPALQKAISLPSEEGFSRSIVVATDGYVAVETEAFEVIRNNLGNANFFPFGIGSSVNRYLIEGMARSGMGEPFIVTKPDEAPSKAEKFRKLIQSPVLTGIKVNYRRFRPYDIEPLTIPDVMAERPVVIFGKWHGEPAGEIIIQGISGNHHFSKKIEIEKAKRSRSYKGLRYLWARHRAAILSDYNKLDKQDERTREITNLGLKYNLLTAYTSFVAIDSRVRGEGEKPMTIKQPLPLPQGVSDYAVGRRKAAFTKRPVLSQPLSPGNTEVASSLGDRKHEYDKEGGNSIKSNAEDEKAVENKILLGSITISGGLLKDDVKLTLDKKMPLLNQCIKKGSRGLMPVNGIFFKLVVDSNGDVKKVVEMGQVKIRKQLMECIRETLKGAKFSKVKKGEKAVIIVQFLLR